MLQRGLGAVVLGCLLIAGCGAPPTTTPTSGATATPSAPLAEPSVAAVPTPAPDLAGRALDGEPLAPCTLGSIPALCGSLSVPEDPAAPAGRSIDLRVAVVPALAPTPEPDPLFMLAGGPGGAATTNLPWAANTFRGIHATRDIVLVDQRGTGESNLHLLDDLPDLAPLTDDEVEATLADWIDASLEDFEGDPRTYTTSVAMDDLDAVRQALGYERINLWGASYGATAAQYYLRQHGDRVRSVVLDGPTLLDVPIFERLPIASQRALDLLFDRCAADEACAAAYPDPSADLERVLSALAKQPITTGVTSPVTGQPLVLDGMTVSGAIHGALLDATSAASIPLVLRMGAAGEWDAVASAILAASGGRPVTDDMPLMSAIIRCSEAWARWRPDVTADLGRDTYIVELQVRQARAQEIGCAHAPEGVVPPDDAAPVRSDVPVLLIVGEADPQDPPANVADAPAWFPNSRTVVVPGHGHTVSHQGCLPRIVDAFVEAGTADDLDASCVDEGGVPLPTFRLP